MRRTQRALTLLWLIAALVAAQVFAQSDAVPMQSPAKETNSWSIDRARVLFTKRTGSTSDLYVYDRGANHVTRLTTLDSGGPGANAGRVSPDGKRVAFQFRDGKNYEIHIIEIRGGRSTNVSRHPDYDVLPVWSPDGERLAFMSTRGYELGSIGPFPGHIYVTSPTGHDARKVTIEPLTSSLGPSDWSADGKTMLIARSTRERPDLFLLDNESGRERRLTDTPEGEYSAVFSHDGRRVAFHSETADDSQIAVMDLDGTQRRNLTAEPGFRYNPRWSPDDRWILFTARADGGQHDLRAVHVDDGTVIDLVATPEDERDGDWFPVDRRSK